MKDISSSKIIIGGSKITISSSKITISSSIIIPQIAPALKEVITMTSEGKHSALSRVWAIDKLQK